LIDSGHTVKGYYTICPSSVRVDGLPPGIKKQIRYAEVPVYLIGRLAVDKGIQGQHEGEHLLLDALWRCYQISAAAASVGVIVDAKDERAKAWYLKLGFIPFEDDVMRLFLPMRTIRELVETESSDKGAEVEPLEPLQGV
jgi:GNAT superfamily N-acetyltransferase